MQTRRIRQHLHLAIFIGVFLLAMQGLAAYGILEHYDIAEYPVSVTETYMREFTDHAQFELVIQRGAYNTAYNPKTADPADTYVYFSAGNSGAVSDRYAVHTMGNEIIHYNLYDNDTDRNLLRDAETAASLEDCLYYRFPSSEIGGRSSITQTYSHSFILEIPSGQNIPSGTYTDSIEISYYHDSELEDNVTMPLTITIDHSIGLCIVDMGSAYDPHSQGYSMDFGVIYPGEVLKADAIACSNSIYSISAYSYNGSVLSHVNPTVTETIPYTVDIDGMVCDLSAAQHPVMLISNAPPTDAYGTAHTLTITIGDFGWVPAGDYSDSLVFEIIGN